MPSDLDRRYAGSGPPLVSVSGAVISYAHTVLGYMAFFGALVIALGMHYTKVVKNGIAGWPDEWWPSVSATIGDWYPERNFFQVGIALMSGPRILLVLLSALLVSLSSPRSSRRAMVLALTGIARTLACGGWVYVTSTDDHDFHDVAMIAYLLLTPAWMYISGTSLSSTAHTASTTDREALLLKGNKYRKIAAGAFFGMIPFMVFFFYRHKVLEIPGAYTYYAFFEWGLIIFDLGFDAASVYDLSRLEIHIVEASEGSKRQGPSKSLVGGAWVTGGTQGAVQAGAWSGSLSGGDKKGSATDGPPKSPSERLVDAQLRPQGKEGDLSAAREFAAFISDVYLNFVFWTNLTGLAPTLFFFSVYNLSIGGEEVAVLTQPIFLGLLLLIWPLRRLLCDDSGNVGPISNKTLAFLHLLTIPSLACWWWQAQHSRLLLVMLGAGVGAITLAVEWGRAWEQGTLHRKISIWLFALVLTNLAKYLNHSNHPLWVFMNSTNGGWNTSGLIVALLAIAELATRPCEASPAVTRTRSKGRPYEGTVAAFGIGAMLYAIPMFISDSGTMIAWTWTGWPISGPRALENGNTIIWSMILATLFASMFTDDGALIVGRHPAFFALGSAAFAALLLLDDWQGFIGAVIVAFWMPITAYPIIRAAMRFNPLRIFAAGWLVSSLLMFFQVLTVAYAFVPVVGPMMREKTWLTLCAQQIFIGAALWYCSPAQPSAKVTLSPSRYAVYLVYALTLTIVISSMTPSLRKVTISVPSHPEERLVTAGIHTVHFGHDQNMYESTRRLSSIYKEMDLDIVGLLETDLHRVVYGNRDLTQWLSEEMGMYADIGPGPKKHTWGAILLSKFPIINSTHHLLPSPHGELAPAIEAWLDIYGVETQVIVSHNGQEEDALDRQLQTEKLAELLSNAWPNPALFLGYVVTKPHAERPSPYKILFEDGRIHDVDPTDNDRWCEYIGFRGVERVGYVRVSRYTVSDTELQTVKLRIPPPGYRIDPDKDTRPAKMTNDTLPLSWQYPWHFYAPTAMVYDRHMYFPRYLPTYFATTPHDLYSEWSRRWEGREAS